MEKAVSLECLAIKSPGATCVVDMTSTEIKAKKIKAAEASARCPYAANLSGLKISESGQPEQVY